MGWTYNTHRGIKKCIDLKGRAHVEDGDVDRSIILKWILKKDRGQWQALVSTVMNLLDQLTDYIQFSRTTFASWSQLVIVVVVVTIMPTSTI